MKIISSLVLIAAVVIFYLWFKQSDYNQTKVEQKKLQYENTQLKDQLDGLQNDPAWLLKNARKEYSEKNYVKAKENVLMLLYNHPEAKEADEAKSLLSDINKKLNLGHETSRSSSFETVEQNSGNTSDPLSKLYSNFDLDNNVTLYQDNSSPKFNNEYGFYLYFVKSAADKIKDLHLKVQYVSSRPLYVEKYILQIDNQKFVYSPKKVEQDKDNSASWEWSDEILNNELNNLVTSIINSKQASIDFIGKNGSESKVITSAQKLALKNVMEAYSRISNVVVDQSGL
jgi:hypothetical protein